MHEIEGGNVLCSHSEGSSRFCVVDGSDAHVIMETLNYKAWAPSLGNEMSPVARASLPGALLGEAGDEITIRLDN